MNCKKCNKTIESADKHLKCVQCGISAHVSCLDEVTDEDYNYILSEGKVWKCSLCLKNKSNRDDETPVTPTIEKSKFIYSTGNSEDESTHSESGVKHKIQCRNCCKGFSYNSSRAKCLKCKSVFHFKCISSITRDEYKKKQESWVCEYCCEKPKVRDIELTLQQTEKEGITLIHILEEMRAFRKEVSNKNKEFSESLNTYSDWVQENTENIKVIDTKLNNFMKEIESIRQENCNLKKNNEQLTKKVVDLEQLLKENTVDIYGVPYKKDEDILKIMKSISEVIGYEYEAGMIDNCYRTKGATAGPAKPGAIVVKFLRKLDKERFIMKRRQKRNVNSRDLGFMDGDASPIYINDSLTQDKRKLLNSARVVGREKQYTFIWVRNGRIFLRKNQGERAIAINSQEDIEKLI